MKTLRLFGLAIAAVILSFAATSCDDDDDDDDGTQTEMSEITVITGQKRITKIKFDGSYVETLYIFYDDKGRLTRAVGDFGEDKYVWEGNTITETERDGDVNILILNNNLVDEEIHKGKDPDPDEDRSYTFGYDEQGRQIRYDDEAVVWEDDRMVQWCHMTFTYSGQTCKGYIPFTLIIAAKPGGIEDIHPELYGMRTSQLPDASNNGPYYYTFDSDGYLASCTAYVGDNCYYYYELTWE